MALLQYKEFRRYTEQRISANNAMMGLLAGSRLAAHTLQLTEGSTHRLSEIFPSVEHIRRFDLRTDMARAVLDDAEQHLGRMAIPYALALHEHFLRHCCTMANSAGALSNSALAELTAKSMHEKFESACNVAFPTESLLLFHLFRCLRNSQIHEGGRANDELVVQREAVSPKAKALWQRLSKRSLPTIEVGDPISLGQPELAACLAVTQRLANDANLGLQKVIPRPVWASRAVDDLLSTGPVTGNVDQRRRKVRAYVRHFYGALCLTDAEVMDAAKAAGIVS